MELLHSQNEDFNCFTDTIRNHGIDCNHLGDERKQAQSQSERYCYRPVCSAHTRAHHVEAPCIQRTLSITEQSGYDT